MSLYDLFNENSEKDFIPILKSACYVSGCKNASISFIKDDFQDVRYTEGNIDPVNLRLSRSICKFTVESEDGFLQIQSLKTDPKTKELIHDPNFPFNFYAGLKFETSDNDLTGTLCLLDEGSKTLDQHQIEALRNIADQLVNVLDLRKKDLEGQKDKVKKEEFNILFNSSPDLICILDENQKILNINNASEKILGFNPQECLGMDIAKFVFHEDKFNVLRSANEALSNGSKNFEVETRLISKTGEIKWISWNAVTKKRTWFIIGREVTKQKELIRNLNQLSTVASKINNGVVISNNKSEVVWVNDAFVKITGYSLNDIIDKKLGDVISASNSSQKRVEEARKATENKQSFSVELLANRKDGKPIWLSVFNTIILDEQGEIESLIEIIVDITDRKLSEEKLELLSLVASETEIGVCISDQNGKVNWINDSLVKLLGYQLEEVVGKRLGDLANSSETDLDTIREGREKAANLIPFNIEIKVNKKDGSEVWLSVSNTPIHDEKQDVYKQIEIISDITQRKLAEFQLVEAKEQAIQLSKAKEMFLSVMSHEIRTPLNAIIGLSNILNDEEKLESQNHTIKLLKFSSDNLLALINDILDFSKIEVGKMELENKRLSINDLIKDIADSLIFKVKEKNIEIIYEVDPNIPALVRGDKTRLYQILINLINNAIKFTDKGFVKITADLISIDKEHTRLNFKVIDTGIGIPEDKYDYIFESFTQAATNTARKYGGSGLGLSITKRLIQLYHGSIKVNSELEKGTTFEFDLRFNNFIDLEQNQVDQTKQQDTLKAKILVVDDNEINRILAIKVLTRYGLEVIPADSGFKAIELLQAKDFDLVLMDVHMPEMTGYETVKKLREDNDEYFDKLPIIALTASILKEDINEINANGMIDYQLKPFKPDELVAKIAKYIKK
ncbi:PAS domain S-box protein [Pedobacter sp. SD-b]|uniref:histidine kinase n=1 Tax=Pedobacter segetis TaxID=2793069 RepID=A0ABS1BKA0_9SPHI|nr:PAS domain-containing hybrid sensor histidine kinase/response regulator [Pedobacter segetis]MBK0383166.1 PAS domain S-box protein [Pedobacter segetis]